jgi:hypothetical protein
MEKLIEHLQTFAIAVVLSVVYILAFYAVAILLGRHTVI